MAALGNTMAEKTVPVVEGFDIESSERAMSQAENFQLKEQAHPERSRDFETQ